MTNQDTVPTYAVTLLPSRETVTVTGRVEIVSGELRVYVWNTEDLFVAGFRDGAWDRFQVVEAP